ncbi:MAG: ABC transporter permease [Acidobacteriota bacterium]
MLRGTLFIAREDLLHMLRQRDVLVWVLLMPGLFFYFIGSATGGAPNPAGSEERPDPLVLVTATENDWLIQGLIDTLSEARFAVERRASPPDEDSARLWLEIDADDPGRQVAAREPVTVKLYNNLEGPGADFYQLRIGRAVYQTAADLVLVSEAGMTLDAESLARLRTEQRPYTLTVSTAGERIDIPSGFEQAVPGIIVMFTMLVLLTTGTHMLAVERELGLLRRLASTPIPRTAVVLGKWLARMALGAVQIAIGMVMGHLLFGVVWHGLPALILVLGGWAAFNAAFAILLANLVTTANQGSAIGLMVTMVLSALGGCWWPIEVTPDWMQQLSRLLPSGWAMDAMHRLVSFGMDAGAVLPHVTAMTLAALLCALGAAKIFRFQ